MKAKITSQFTIFCCIVLFSWFAGAKYQVCSITINSSDEIEVFKEGLGAEDFDFVELVPLSKESSPNDTNWFKKACQQPLSCDVLIISGHFGGLFFGENHNYILPVEIMEQLACSNACLDILHNVREVFLFGCNTLARKHKDRTPEEYLQVLLDHNMARDMAEIVVAGRYLPFGLSFRDQMRMIFTGQSRIYGFSSLSPLGHQIRQPLRDYLLHIKNRYGSYKAYLDQKDPFTENPLLRQSVGNSISEAMGLQPNDSQFSKFQKICHLYQEDIGAPAGIKTVYDLMNNAQGPEAYYAIESFISKHKPFEGESGQILESIKSNPGFRDNFYNLYSQISTHLPYIRIHFLNFLQSFSWIDSEFYRQEVRLNLLRMLKQPNAETLDFVIRLKNKAPHLSKNLELNNSDIPLNFYQNVYSALILETLNVQDNKMHGRLMDMCLSHIETEPVLCYQVLKTLGHLKVKDPTIIREMIRFLHSDDNGLVYYAIYGLAYSNQRNLIVHLDIVQQVQHSDPNVQIQALRALEFLESQYPQVNNILVSFLEQSIDQVIIEESLRTLQKMNPDLAVLRRVIEIRGFKEHHNLKIKQLALSFY